MDVVELKAFPGREVALPCGCAIVESLPRRIRDGRFELGAPELVVVPCCDDEEHVGDVRGRAFGEFEAAA